MRVYYTKEGLYKEVCVLKHNLGFSENEYGINLISTLLNKNYKIEIVPFNTKGLRGMAFVGTDNKDDIILLNSKRSNTEQNFDCGHEMIHLNLHRQLHLKTFNCFDKIQPQQNSFIEWQANEGAAEFFVPYKILLPIIKQHTNSLNCLKNIKDFKYQIALLFKVPEAVITYRLENLKYELLQYLVGLPLDRIEILSAKKQEEQHIFIKSLNELTNPDYSKQMLGNYSFLLKLYNNTRRFQQ